MKHRLLGSFRNFLHILAIFGFALGLLSVAVFISVSLLNKPQNPIKTPLTHHKSLTLAYSQNVGALNPQGYGKNAMFAQNLVFEGLVRLNKNGEIIPSLATSWSVDKEGKIYTFSLRQGVRFSNGEEFNADAVVLNFTSILKNRVRHSWSGLVEAITSVEKVDDYAVRLVLKSPYAPTLNELALVRPFRFLAPSAFPPDLDLVKHNPHPIGTGAYMLAESKAGAYDKFVKNPHYWDTQRIQTNNGLYYDEVLIKVIFEPHSKLAALKAGQVDMIYGADEIPTRIFMEVANEDKTFCHIEGNARNISNELQNPNCRPKRSEVSHKAQKRDISPTAQYDNVEAICNDKENSPSLAEGVRGRVDSANDKTDGQNPPKNPEFKAYLGKEAFVTSLIVNSTHLREARVREAIALAIDKESAINAVYGELASIADSIFVYDGEDSHLSLRGDTICHTEATAEVSINQPICHLKRSEVSQQAHQNQQNRDISVFCKNLNMTSKHSQNLSKARETNVQKAREILSKLGYNADNPLAIELIFKSDKPNQKMLAQIFQAQLKSVNIALSVRGLEPSMFYNRLKEGSFEIAFSESWGAPYEPLSQLYSYTKPLGHGDYLAQSGLPNKREIDATILQAINAPNENQARKHAKEAIALLLESRVYIPLAIERNKAIANGRIKGVENVSGVSYEIPVWEFYE